MSREYIFDNYPHLKDEWDFDKNDGIDPAKISRGSGKKVWWICKCGNSWRTQVRIRVNGQGCSPCYMKSIAESNPLPDHLSGELDDPKYRPEHLSRGTTRKVWWKCSGGHRYKAPVASRVYQSSGCPYCSGRSPIVGETDLATLRPDLVKQWAEESLDPSELTTTSKKRVKWMCSKGHYWVARVCHRTSSKTKGSGCPYCPGSRGQHAKILVGVNDLGTLHPDIAKQLYSTDITPQELREYSNRRCEWICSEGHIWATTVAGRVLGNQCPQCIRSRTSQIEDRLRVLIRSNPSLYGTVPKTYHNLDVPWRNNKSMEVDIYCGREKPLVIEYDGEYWHSMEGSIGRDTDKTLALITHNYLVVRIRENNLPFIGVQHPNLLQLNTKYSREDDDLEDAVKEIESWLVSRE